MRYLLVGKLDVCTLGNAVSSAHTALLASKMAAHAFTVSGIYLVVGWQC